MFFLSSCVCLTTFVFLYWLTMHDQTRELENQVTIIVGIALAVQLFGVFVLFLTI